MLFDSPFILCFLVSLPSDVFYKNAMTIKDQLLRNLFKATTMCLLWCRSVYTVHVRLHLLYGRLVQTAMYLLFTATGSKSRTESIRYIHKGFSPLYFHLEQYQLGSKNNINHKLQFFRCMSQDKDCKILSHVLVKIAQ